MIPAAHLEKLEEAIERARLPGMWLYAEGGEPACVIGQLAALEGITVERMEKWTGGVRSLQAKAPELHEYPLLLLDRLQLVWDTPWESANRLRLRMWERVQQWRRGELSEQVLYGGSWGPTWT